MIMTLTTNCEFCRECQFFHPEIEKLFDGAKAGWQMNCYYRKYCENAIQLFLQKQENKARQTDNASSSWFNFIDDSREKQ